MTQDQFGGRLALMRSWAWNDYTEAMLVPHGRWKCLAVKTSVSVMFSHV